MRRSPYAVAAAAVVTAALAVTTAAPADAVKPVGTKTSAVLSATTAPLGAPVSVTGTVLDAVKGKRRVELQLKIASGWHTVDKTKTSTDGAYAFTLPTNFVYSTKVRVMTLRAGRAPADASRSTRVAVVPTWAPTGQASAWAYVYKPPVRVNPCQTVTYKVNAAQGLPDPASALAAAMAATDAITHATGVSFRYTGTTDLIPGAPGGRWPGGTDVVIGWARPDQTKTPIGGDVAARGGSEKVRRTRDARGRPIFDAIRSTVVLDATQPYTTATGTAQLLMHELGHVMGLGHVDDTGQYMNPTASLYALPFGQWGAGDLTGFQKVGLMAGCVS